MLININNVSQAHLLYVFRDFYSQAIKLNIMLYFEDKDLPDKIKSSNIMDILKKDISSLKLSFGVLSYDSRKAYIATDVIDNILKYDYSEASSVLDAVSNILRVSNILTNNTDKGLIANKWLLISFFEKILPTICSAYDAINYMNTISALDINKEDFTKSLTSKFTNNIIKPNADIRYITINLYSLLKYLIDTDNSDKLLYNFTDMKELFYKYLYTRELEPHGSEAAAEYLHLINNICDNASDVNSILDIVSSYSDDDYNDYNNISSIINNSMIFGKNLSDKINANKSKFLSIVSQTKNIILDDNNAAYFNIPDDFKIYFLDNSDEFNPIFIKKFNNNIKDSYSNIIISYNNIMYLLYLESPLNKDTVYGVSLSQEFNEPNSIIKIDKDPDGEYRFII